MFDRTQRLRAAIYARVSGEEQATEGNSLPDQVERCQKEVHRRDWTVVATFIEEGFTGTKESRPEWDRLLQAARDGLMDVVVVTRWSRLARSIHVGLNITSELDRLNVGLVVMEADIDTSTSGGRLLRNVMFSVTEFDRETIIENMARGARRAATDRGVWPCSMTPFGYKHAGEGNQARLIIDPVQQRIILRATEWLVDDGLTTGQVAKQLNALGWLPPKGGLWSHQNLRQKLMNRSLLGEHVWGRNPEDRRRDSARHVPGKFGPPVIVQTDPILTPERYNALQDALARRAYGRKADAKPYPLSGMLVCTCGQPFGGANRADRDLRQYRCRAAKWRADGQERCRSRRLDANWVDELVWTELCHILATPDRLRACADDWIKLTGSKEMQAAVVRQATERDEIEKRIKDLQRGLERATEKQLLADDPSLMQTMIDKFTNDLAGVQRTREELMLNRHNVSDSQRRGQSLMDLLNRAEHRLYKMPLEERGKVLSLLDVQVHVLDAPPGGPARGGRQSDRQAWKPRLRLSGAVPAQVALPPNGVGDPSGAMAPAGVPQVTGLEVRFCCELTSGPR